MAIRLYEASRLAKVYALYRPQYGTKIRDIIQKFMNKHGCSYDTVLDVACGSGQSIRCWTASFKKCIGVDISEEQIKQAREKFDLEGIGHVDFRISPAESLPSDVKECDLVTMATAWHWVDASDFYREADRVLKSPGVLAVYAYSLPYFPDNPEASQVIGNFFHVTLKDCLHENTKHIFNRYSAVKLPFEIEERHDFDYEWCVPLSHLVGLLSSADACWKYVKDHPGTTVLSQVKEDLKCSLHLATDSDDDPTIRCLFPTFINIGLKRQ